MADEVHSLLLVVRRVAENMREPTTQEAMED